MNTNECSPVCVGPESVRAEESAAPDPETHIFDGSGRWLCRRGRLDESRSLKKKCTICVERWQARRAAPRAPSVDDAMDALTVVDAGPLRLDPAKVRELLHAIGPEALAAGMAAKGMAAPPTGMEGRLVEALLSVDEAIVAAVALMDYDIDWQETRESLEVASKTIGRLAEHAAKVAAPPAGETAPVPKTAPIGAPKEQP